MTEGNDGEQAARSAGADPLAAVCAADLERLRSVLTALLGDDADDYLRATDHPDQHELSIERNIRLLRVARRLIHTPEA